MVVSGQGLGSATLLIDFRDLQPVRSVTFPPYVYNISLLFNITDDIEPEIAESFQLVLLEETIRGDAVLVSPNTMLVTIEPNDKPYGVLSISSSAVIQQITINEDLTQRLITNTAHIMFCLCSLKFKCKYIIYIYKKEKNKRR